jgi:hypothetical protein
MEKFLKKVLLTIIGLVFPLLVFGQTVSWENLTQTAELGRQQAFSLFDGISNTYLLGGGLADEIGSANGSQYYLIYGTTSTAYPYYLTTKNNNTIYSKNHSEQYIYTEALNNTFNVFGCTGSQPYPGSVIWQSPDGANWTSTTQTADPLEGAVIEFDGWIYRLGGVCACPTPVYSNNIARSADGVNFTTLTTTGVFSARDGIIPIVSTDGATLYAVGGHYNAGTDVYYKSVYKTTDGATWTTLTTSGAFGNITQGGTGWSYNNILYVYNNATGIIYSSVDGITWTAETVVGGSGPGSLLWPSAVYTGNNGLLVLGGYTGTSYPATAWYGSVDTSALTPTSTPVQSTSLTLTQTLTQTATYTQTPISAWWTPTPAATLPLCLSSPFPNYIPTAALINGNPYANGVGLTFAENPTPVLIPVLTPEAGWLSEPNVIDIGNVGAVDRFHMTYTGGTPSEYIFLATAPVPEGPWTRAYTHPVIGLGYGGVAGQARMSAQLKIGTEWRVYFENLSDYNIYYCTSYDGYTYYLNPTPVMKTSDFTAGMGCTPQGIDGLEPVYNPQTGYYNALVEIVTGGCPAGSPAYVLMLVESKDNASTFYLKDNAPLSGIQPYGVGYSPLYAGGRATFYVNGHWATFPHIDMPTYITYAISPDLYNWQTGPLAGVYDGEVPSRRVVTTYPTVWGLTACDQAADSSIIEYNGSSYLFYSHDDNTNSQGRIGYSKFSGTLSDYDACFIPSASPTITNTVTLTPIVPTSTITPTFTVTPVSTPWLQFVKTDTNNNVTVRWPNTDFNNTYLLQYGLNLENSITLSQNFNQSQTNNYFCYSVCCFMSGVLQQIRVTQYNPAYSAVLSNTIYVNPQATPTPGG